MTKAAAACVNSECCNGKTPGIVITPKPKPQIGQQMRWGWVPCPACHPDPKLAPYKPYRRTPEEVAERAKKADQRTVYAKTVSNPAPAAPQPPPPAPETTPPYEPAPMPSAAVALGVSTADKQLAIITSLTETVNRLLAENATLRAENAELLKPKGDIR